MKQELCSLRDIQRKKASPKLGLSNKPWQALVACIGKVYTWEVEGHGTRNKMYHVLQWNDVWETVKIELSDYKLLPNILFRFCCLVSYTLTMMLEPGRKLFTHHLAYKFATNGVWRWRTTPSYSCVLKFILKSHPKIDATEHQSDMTDRISVLYYTENNV